MQGGKNDIQAVNDCYTRCVSSGQQYLWQVEEFDCRLASMEICTLKLRSNQGQEWRAR